MATITIKFDSDETRTGKTVLAKALFNQLKKLGYEVEFDFTEETKRSQTIYHMEMQYKKLGKDITFDLLTNPRAKIIIIPE